MKNLIPVLLLLISFESHTKQGVKAPIATNAKPIVNPVSDPNVAVWGTWSSCHIYSSTTDLNPVPLFELYNKGARVYNIFPPAPGQRKDREQYVQVTTIDSIPGLLEVKVAYNQEGNGSVRITATDLETKETESMLGNMDMKPTRHGQGVFMILQLQSEKLKNAKIDCTRS